MAPVKDAGYANVYGIDVTERRRAEEQKEQLEALKYEIKMKQDAVKLKTNEPPPQKFMKKSFDEFKEESGYSEDIPF